MRDRPLLPALRFSNRPPLSSACSPASDAVWGAFAVQHLVCRDGRHGGAQPDYTWHLDGTLPQGVRLSSFLVSMSQEGFVHIARKSQTPDFVTVMMHALPPPWHRPFCASCPEQSTAKQRGPWPRYQGPKMCLLGLSTALAGPLGLSGAEPGNFASGTSLGSKQVRMAAGELLFSREPRLILIVLNLNILR